MSSRRISAIVYVFSLEGEWAKHFDTSLPAVNAIRGEHHCVTSLFLFFIKNFPRAPSEFHVKSYHQGRTRNTSSHTTRDALAIVANITDDAGERVGHLATLRGHASARRHLARSAIDERSQTSGAYVRLCERGTRNKSFCNHCVDDVITSGAVCNTALSIVA